MFITICVSMMLPEIMRYNIIFHFEFVMMEHYHTPILSPTGNWSRYLGLKYLDLPGIIISRLYYGMIIDIHNVKQCCQTQSIVISILVVMCAEFKERPLLSFPLVLRFQATFILHFFPPPPLLVYYPTRNKLSGIHLN